MHWLIELSFLIDTDDQNVNTVKIDRLMSDENFWQFRWDVFLFYHRWK